MENLKGFFVTHNSRMWENLPFLTKNGHLGHAIMGSVDHIKVLFKH